MGYIGIAAAIGLIIDIPVVIRSLADSLALADHDTLPLDIGEQLLSYPRHGIIFRRETTPILL